ncbi:hypothetical protein FDF86_14545 [Clostridium botulinum]|nr:hypothetical protein [Clostridium botulinum]
MINNNEYGKNFLEFLLTNNLSEDEIRGIIRNYSYFVYIISDNYNYNVTYLESYCSDLNRLKQIVKEKNNTFNQLVNVTLELIDISMSDNFNIIMDDFWQYQNNEIFHSGKVDFKKLLNRKIHIECKYSFNNISKIYYEEYIFDDSEIKRKLTEFIKSINKGMNT